LVDILTSNFDTKKENITKCQSEKNMLKIISIGGNINGFDYYKG